MRHVSDLWHLFTVDKRNDNDKLKKKPTTFYGKFDKNFEVLGKWNIGYGALFNLNINPKIYLAGL